MSKGKDIPGSIRLLAIEPEGVSAGEVARHVGVTRQAAHYHLRRMVETGDLERTGGGRSTRYRATADLDLRLPIAGLDESRVWHDVRDRTPALVQARDNVRAILAYAFTEMVNNAIEHSGGTEVRVIFRAADGRFAFEVHDDGIGAYRHLRERFGLEDDLAALQLLTRGKETTSPDRHSGEGIFFTSRAVDRFELDANHLRWIVETSRADQAVGDSPPHPGTRVRCRIAADSPRSIAEVFADYVDDGTLRFSRTVLPLRLFQPADGFIARADADRVTTHLERFEEVVLDFTGVTEVGQGFVDEVFRVWASANPGTRLVPKGASPIVDAVVRRAIRSIAGGASG